MISSATNDEPDLLDTLPEPVITRLTWLVVLMALAGGALLAVVVKAWVPVLADSISGPSPRGYQHLARASGGVAYALLWLSMALGLLMTNKMARTWPGGPRALDLHQHVSLLSLAFSLFHILVLLGVPGKDYTLAQLFVPLADIPFHPFMWLGKLCFYLLALVSLSFYFRKRIGNRAWRRVHFLSFALFLLALAHALLTGTDRDTMWASSLYLVTAGSLAIPAVYRVVGTRKAGIPEIRSQRKVA